MRISLRRSVIVSRQKAFATFSDSFSLLSGLKSGWNQLNGTWSLNGSAASSSSNPDDRPIAYVKMSRSDYTASVGVSKGTGIAFWISSGGSWWATTSIEVATSTTYDCNPYSCNPYNCNPHDCNCNPHTVYTCPMGGTLSEKTCTLPATTLTNYGTGPTWESECNAQGGVYYPSNGGTCVIPGSSYSATPTTVYDTCTCYDTCYQTCYQTCTSTSYSQYLKLYNSNSGVVSEATSAVSLPSAAAAIWLQTSGNSITAKAYSDTNLSTQIGSTLTYTPSSPTKTGSVGIIKMSSSNQGSTVTSFTSTINV